MSFYTFIVGVIFFIIGLPMFIVFTLRWRDSVDFEENSTLTDCTVVKVKTIQTCTDDNGAYTGTRWGYNVEVPLCNNKNLYRGDDTCNDAAISLGSTRLCRVHDDCETFKWKHQTEVNKNVSFVGAGILGVSFVLFAVAFYLCLKKKNSHSTTRVTAAPEVSSPNDNKVMDIPNNKTNPTCPDDYSDSVV